MNRFNGNGESSRDSVETNEKQSTDDSVSLLQMAIERSVRMRTGGTIRDLRVDIDGDDVIVSGRATTYYIKQLAAYAVFETINDVCLTNEIEVY
ncbi:hypothetical protein HOF56_00840 [Candidatus Peribacteria bacterium]|jgi:hypothetical protein|nr:hypothetical protein [Candidatus Peribacteria bacterium]MBT4021622.1 hypothetical protein [Candidatus Peribacteria bacterium]MBT4240882.1 hypothetical protein [Candidatus Peribacteria bacterium]MBT4474105.1 hypothetical protein [Candidatus Peribacteria bacterium]